MLGCAGGLWFYPPPLLRLARKGETLVGCRSWLLRFVQYVIASLRPLQLQIRGRWCSSVGYDFARGCSPMPNLEALRVVEFSYRPSPEPPISDYLYLPPLCLCVLSFVRIFFTDSPAASFALLGASPPFRSFPFARSAQLCLGLFGCLVQLPTLHSYYPYVDRSP